MLRSTIRLSSVMVVLGFVLASASAQQQCPPNSHRTGESATQLFCKCNAGYTKSHGRCRPVAEVRAELEERLRNAVSGGQASLYAWGQLMAGAAVEEALASLRQLASARRITSKNALAVEINVVRALGKMKDCSYSNTEQRATCENIWTFIRLVRETRGMLEELERDQSGVR